MNHYLTDRRVITLCDEHAAIAASVLKQVTPSNLPPVCACCADDRVLAGLYLLSHWPVDWPTDHDEWAATLTDKDWPALHDLMETDVFKATVGARSLLRRVNGETVRGDRSLKRAFMLVLVKIGELTR